MPNVVEIPSSVLNEMEACACACGSSVGHGSGAKTD